MIGKLLRDRFMQIVTQEKQLNAGTIGETLVMGYLMASMELPINNLRGSKLDIIIEQVA